jgi:ribosomal protein L37AE/L43A
MSKVDRNNPKRSTASESSYSMMEFMREYPDDAACLESLWRSRISADGEHAECPKCERTRKFHRVKSRPSWSCDTCGHHIHPTAGTIFHRSATSLHLWFYAMYLMTSTRCGVSAKHLERELGVTYKTAWRMANLIRNQLMAQDGDEPLEGDVEVDETAGGGKIRASDTRKGHQHVVAKMSRRPTIWGAVERGGRVRARVVKSRAMIDVEGPIFQYVLPSSMIFTDEWGGYSERIGSKYIGHRRIRHEDRVYVSGAVHTQTIEGFFGNLKNGIRGNYHSVSRGLPQRVRLALQPPQGRARDVQDAAAARRRLAPGRP